VLALESSLADVRVTLHQLQRVSSLRPNSEETIPNPKSHQVIPNAATVRSVTPQTNGPLVADRNSRTAPASLIRDMKHYILGEERERRESDASEDIVTKGIITEDMTHTLLVG
jgi:hypothetical protein